MAGRDHIRLRTTTLRTRGVRQKLPRPAAPGGSKKQHDRDDQRGADVQAVENLEGRAKAALGEARATLRTRKDPRVREPNTGGRSAPGQEGQRSGSGQATARNGASGERPSSSRTTADTRETRAAYRSRETATGGTVGANTASTHPDVAKQEKQTTYRSRNRATSAGGSPGGRTQTPIRTRARDMAAAQRQPLQTPSGQKNTRPAGRTARKKPAQSFFQPVKRTKAHALSRKAAKKAAAAAASKTRLTAQIKQMVSKVTARTFSVGGKALLAMIKGALTFLFGLSAPMLIVVACAGAIVAAISSPLGILFTGDSGTTDITLSMAMTQADYAYTLTQDTEIAAYDADRVIYNYVGSDDGVRIENWPDVLAVYAVLTNMPTDGSEGVDVLEFDIFKVTKLTNIYAEMNPYDFDVTESEVETAETDEDGEPVTEIERTLTVNQFALSRFDAYTQHSFDQERIDIAEELYGEEEFRNLIVQLRGEDFGLPVTDEELEKIFGKLPDNAIGSDVVKTAFTRLGYPYSKMDCSDFTGWAYAQNGVRISSYAAGQAKECYDNGWVVSVANLQPGDLVFFSSGKDNGRFLKIDHVGIYVGNGMIIDSSSSNGKVVYRKMWTSVLCGRPGLGTD